ncbi:MAG: LEA type 2 family protein [Thermodesulfobacteriota bacterium]
MQKKSIALILSSLFIIAAFFAGCAGMTAKPTASNFQAPKVTLNYVDVAHYFGWWFYDAKVAPVKGNAGNNGAPLDFAFVFDIQNPNPFPVMLESLKFACTLDGFEVNSGYSTEAQWIPPGKTNQLRVEVMYDILGTQMSLLIVAGNQLKEKGVGIWDQLEKIWVKAPDFAYPVGVIQGSAVFKADGLTKVAAFDGKYPK